ncbi:MAG: FliG C-terminal domain-containing protein [Pirellulaceae bacterium]
MTNSAIRKAAILISTLDNASGDALLEQMGPELAERVRNALMELDEIPEGEEQQVIADFMGRSSGGGDNGVEFDPSLAQRIEEEVPEDRGYPRLHSPEAPLRTNEPPFHFLRGADPSLLASYLEREHPQTTAVVISHLPPEQAASVLEQMPAEISTEALRRMAWLDELSPEVLRDVEREIRTALQPKMRPPEARMASLASVQAVLSAVKGARRSELLGRLAEQDRGLVRQLGFGERTDASAFQYRLEPPSLLGSNESEQSRERGTHDLEVAAEEFEELFSLDDRDLRRLFAAAELPVLVLALTGANEKCTRRILKQLPLREADVLRQRLTHPGPLRLRDIEAAQQEIVRLAHMLASRGEINLKAHTFAAAV